MRYSVQIGQIPHVLTIEPGDDHQWRVMLDEQPLTIDLAQMRPGWLSVIIGQQSFEIYLRRLPIESEHPDTLPFEAIIDGALHPITLIDERRRALSGSAGGGRASAETNIKAPMPGLVAQVLVAPGDTVEAGQRAVVLEAMKMQNDLSAPRAGIVRAVKVEQGQAVNQGQVLVVIGDPTAPPPET